MLILIGLCFLVGFVFMLVSLILHQAGRHKELHCSSYATGTVIENVRYRPNTDANYAWYPIFQYFANGSWHRKRCAYGTAKPLFKIGSRVSIRFDPDKPESFFVEDMTVGRRLKGIFFYTGLGIFCFGLILIVAFR